MLVLTVKKDGSVNINGVQIVVTVKEISGGNVQLAIEAPRDIPIRRTELKKAKSNDGHQ